MQVEEVKPRHGSITRNKASKDLQSLLGIRKMSALTVNVED